MPRERKDLETHKLQNTKPSYVEPGVTIAHGRPRYPKDLPTEGRRVYKNIARLLERRRSLTEADGELIRLLAIAHVRHSKAISMLETEGEIKTYYRLDKHGESVPSEKENLWLQVATNAEKFMVGVYDRLGLTPLNRAKVKQVDQPKASQTNAQDEALLSREATPPETDDPNLDDIDENVVLQ